MLLKGRCPVLFFVWVPISWHKSKGREWREKGRKGKERKREGDTYNCIERTVERHREGQRQGTKVDKTLIRGPALGTVLGTSNAFLGGRTLLWLFC